MRTILLLGTAREQSTRLPDKMTRPILNSSLYEIYLNKFETILAMEHPFTRIGMAISKTDKSLWKMSKNTPVPIIERSEKSVSSGISRRSEELHFLRNMDEDYVMWVNGCQPFLKPESIIAAGNFFSINENIKSLTCVKYRRNWFWDSETKVAINNKDPKCVSTQGCPPLLETVHAFHIFNRRSLLKNDSYWNLERNDPYLYIIKDDIEFLDIDSELDLKVCEAIWQKTN